jgi:autotransporter-associated beta strand protein
VQTLSGSNTYTGGTNVSSGTLAFASPTAFPAFTSLNVIGGTAMAAIHNSSSPKNTLFVSGLSISGATGAWTGTVDLTNNEMVVRNGSFATVLNQIVQGYAGGSWQGSGGILSSAAAADPRHLTTLAVVQNSMDGTTTGNPIFTTFDGQTVTDSDVLVKYTYYGDANLDGTVDGTDYSRIDNGYLMGLTGWYNGDFNYDGVIDGSDYTLIDNAYNQQGASLAASVATPTAQIENSSVPEPATSSLLALGAVGLLSRRRTGRHRN